MRMRKLLTITALIVAADQITKLAVKGFDLFGFQWQGMALYESRSLLGDAVRLTFVENPGMAFGWNFDMPMVLSLFSIAASCFLVYLIKRTESPGLDKLRLAFAVILAGAVGNLIDRVFYGVFYGYASLFHGMVVDFIDIDIPDINILGFSLQRFYVFNIADAAVSVGVVMLLLFYPNKKEEPAAALTTDDDTAAGSLPGSPATETGTLGSDSPATEPGPPASVAAVDRPDGEQPAA